MGVVPTSDLEAMLAIPWSEPTHGMTLGNYRLLDKLGRGGYGVVWKAYDHVAAREVAIKIFHTLNFTDGSRGQEASRFVDGARALRRLDHEETVVTILEGPTVTGPYLWFAMEYAIEGNLHQALASGSLTIADKARIIDDLFGAIGAAHRNKIRHRDIRPHNILLRKSGGAVRAMLADFDLSYFEHVLLERQSTVGVLGLHRYYPPEVLRAAGDDLKRLLRRYDNDRYALAMVMFDMFAGEDVSLPEERSLKAFLSCMSENGLHGRGEWRTRRAVAAFCSYALSNNEKKRFSTVEEGQFYWLSAAGKVGDVSRAIGAISVLALLNAAIILDWACGRYATSLTVQTFAKIAGGILSAGVVVAAGSWSQSLVRQTIPKWTLALGRLVSGKPMLSWIAVVCLAALAPTLGLATNLRGRMVSCWAMRAKDCVLLKSDGSSAVTVSTDSPTSLGLAGAFPVLRCPKGSDARTLPMTWIGQNAKVEGAETTNTRYAVKELPQESAAELLRQVADRMDGKSSDLYGDISLTNGRVKLVVFLSNKLDLKRTLADSEWKQVREAIRKHMMSRVMSCYDRHSVAMRESDVRMKIRLAIDQNGRVGVRPTALASSVGERHPLTECVLTALEKWEFAGIAHDIVLDLGVHFKSLVVREGISTADPNR